MTFSQLGPNVVASGSGSIDLNGLTFITSGFTQPEVAPTFATEATGAAGAVDEYGGASGPVSFGPGVFTSATTGAGDLAGIRAAHWRARWLCLCTDGLRLGRALVRHRDL